MKLGRRAVCVRIGAAVLPGALAPLLGGCSREPEPTLRIGTNVWIGSEPLYLARELGHLDPKVVRLVEYPSASEVLRAFRNGAIDGMAISLDELLGLAADGMRPRAVLAIDISHGADVVLGRAGMKTMRDLRGRRVAVESGALGAYVLTRALALEGMSTADLQVVHLDSNEQPRAFIAGEVDGAVSFDPYRSQMLRAGAVQLFDSTRIPGEIVDVLAVRDHVLQRQPLAVQALLAGWFRALEHLRHDPDDAARRMGLRQQTSGAQFLRALQGLRLPLLEENLKLIGGPQPELAASARRLLALMQEARLLRASLDVGELFAPLPLAQLAQAPASAPSAASAASVGAR